MKPSTRGNGLELEDWMAHLYHILSGQWAYKQCRVCALNCGQKHVPPQWESRPA